MSTSTRRLAAIMFTDVVGYTTLMGNDEALAIRTLNSHEKYVESLTSQHNGKVVQFMGDGSLTVFDSALDALRCARDLQRSLVDDHYVPLRIGLHIGEVLEKDGKVYGDGVNLASRVESSGYAGTVLMSSDFHNKIKNQAEFEFADMGMFSLKNVPEPMRIFALAGPGMEADASRLSNRVDESGAKKRTWGVLIEVLIVLAAAIGVWFSQSGSDAEPSTDDNLLHRIVVFPFDIKAPSDVSYLSEGLVDLFSTRIDGVSGYNAVDPNVVVAQARDRGLNESSPTEYAEAAEDLGASEFILGNLTVFGDDIRIKMSLYNAEADLVSDAEVIIPSLDSLLEAVDAMTRMQVASKYERSGQESIAAQVMFSEDLEAVTLFLKGEEYRRNGELRAANRAFTGAINRDSTMALAWLRLWQVCTWNLECPGREYDLARNAIKYRTNLPLKMQEYVEAQLTINQYGGKDGKIAAFESLIARYGENADFLTGLGEAIFHAPINIGVSPLDALPYFLKAYETDPGNLEVLNHVGQLLTATGDTNTVKSILEELSPEVDNWAAFQVAYLISRTEDWSDDDVIEVLNSSGFNIESIFFRVRSEKYLVRFTNFYRDLLRLNEKPFVTPNVPVDMLVAFWTGNDIKSGTSAFKDNPGLYSMPLYNVEADRSFRNAVFNIDYSNFQSGRAEHGVYPDDFPLAILSLADNDLESYEVHLQELKTLAAADGKYRRCIAMAEALYQRRIGQFEASNALLDSVLVMSDGSVNRLGNGFISCVATTTIAENFNSLGDYDSAFRILNDQFIILSAGDDRLVSYSYLFKAELLEKLGRYLEAADYYNKFLEIFAKADEDYAHWLQRAEEGRTRVLPYIN